MKKIEDVNIDYRWLTKCSKPNSLAVHYIVIIN